MELRHVLFRSMHTDDPATLPAMFTWDMGLKAKLTKMKLWPRNSNDDRWTRGHPRVFEIYESLAPNPEGSLDDSWTLLGTFECVQPEGKGLADQIGSGWGREKMRQDKKKK